MLKCALVFCLLAQASLGLVRPVVRPAPKLRDPQSDEYIDKILENLRNLIIENNMDPMALPDLETGFSDTILGITWHGSARLTAYIGIRGASAHYDASAEFMGISVGAKATADISDLQIYLDAEMVLTGGSGLKLTDFQISHLGNISI